MALKTNRHKGELEKTELWRESWRNRKQNFGGEVRENRTLEGKMEETELWRENQRKQNFKTTFKIELYIVQLYSELQRE